MDAAGLKPIATDGESMAAVIGGVGAWGFSIGDYSRPTRAAERNGRDHGGFRCFEGASHEDSGACSLFLNDVSLVFIRLNFHQDEAVTSPAKAILKHNDNDQQGACPERNDGGGDEKLVAFAGFGKDKEVDRANENTKG